MDATVAPDMTVAVAFEGGIFIKRCLLRGLDFCFWFLGELRPVVRATWGRDSVPVVLGLVVAFGRPL